MDYNSFQDIFLELIGNLSLIYAEVIKNLGCSSFGNLTEDQGKLSPVLLINSSPSINKTNSGTVSQHHYTTSGKNIESGKFDWTIFTYSDFHLKAFHQYL